MTPPLNNRKGSVAGGPEHTVGDNPGLSIPELLAAQATRHAALLALSAMSQGKSRLRLNYAELHKASLVAASRLSKTGLIAGDRLGIYLTNDWALECFVAALGALTLGAVVVPLNTRSAAPELAHAIVLTTPYIILCDGGGQARLDEALELAQADTGFCGADILDPASLTSVSDPSEHQAYANPGPDALGCLLFTSGTTAWSKAVMHSHRTMIATGRCSGGALGLRVGDIYQGAFPFFTSSALNLAGLSCWVAGAGLVIEGQIDTEARLDLIRSERTSVYHGVPSILNFMSRSYDPQRHDVTGVRMIANGGATMPGELTERIARLWPWVTQVQIYGMTESGPAGTVLPPERLADKAGSVGHAMDGMTVEILDDESQPLPPGTLGEIALTGAPVALGYYRNPEATAAAFYGRQIRTGDVGKLDADGFLWFGDRKKDLINRGGLKIASVSVEDVLYRHPDVLEAAVIAVPHPNLGEDVAAVIAARPGVANEELAAALQTLCQDALADYAVPRHIIFRDGLPRNPMGKIVKAALRRDAAEYLATRAGSGTVTPSTAKDGT
ncbi:MAG: acyl--CoA ligase [Rhodobacterales bacterium]|nr:acyl--CoA ligase [Rhodobacterales bacterium]